MQDIYQKLNSDYLDDELVNKLINIPGEDIAKLMIDLDINFPRSVRFKSLKRVLLPILEEEYENLRNAERGAEGPERLEESRRLTRLTWAKFFSETQFENEIFKFNNRETDKKYLTEFWREFITYLKKEAISMEVVGNFAEKIIHRFQNTPPLRLFNKALEPHIYDENNTFDGLEKVIFAERVVLSATISELKQIGAKYGIKVPTRLTKIQVLEIIVKELKERGKYIPEIHADLNDFNLKELEDFARLNDIIAFAYINKDQMIEYMFDEFEEIRIMPKRIQTADDTTIIEEDVVEDFQEHITEDGVELESVAVDEEDEIESVIEIEDITEIIEERKPTEPEKIEVIEKLQEPAVQVAPQPVVTQFDSAVINDLKTEVLALKDIVIELKNQVVLVHEENKKNVTKLEKISKGLVPKWFKRLILVLFIIFVLLAVFVPLSYYYPDAPVISQIAFVLKQIPFFGGRDFLSFLHRIFERFVLTM